MSKTTKFFSSVFLLLIAFSIFSCGGGKANDAADVSNSIPADATGVLLMNTKQLMDKADFATLQQTEFYKSWIAEAEKENPELVPFLKDPAASGISLNSNMGLYFSIPKDYSKTNNFDLALILPVGDKAKLTETLKIVFKDKPNTTTTEKTGYKITTKEKKDIFLIESDKIFAITTFDDDAKIQKIINPTGENIKSNASYAKHLKEGKDIMFWMGADPIVEAALSNPFMAMSIKGSLGMAQIPEEGLKGNYMSFYYDFQNGEIDNGIAFDFSEALKTELGGMFVDKLASDYSKFIPADNLAAAASFGVNADGILKFLAKRGFDKMLDNQLAITGLNLGQIRDGITGDMAIGVYAPATQGADPGVVLALGLKDKAFMEGLLAKFGPMAGVAKDGDKYRFKGETPMDPTEKAMEFVAVIKGDMMLVSSSNELLDKALAGGKNATVAELQEGWLGFYFNNELFQQHHDAITSIIPMDENDISLSKMMAQYNDFSSFKVSIKGDHADGKAMLKTTNMNSLKRIIQIADELFKNREKIQAELDKRTEDEFDSFEDEFNDEPTDKKNT